MRITTLAAAGLLIGGALGGSAAHAADDDYCAKTDRAQWMSESDLKAKYVALGYDVRSVDVEHGCWEIKGFDKNQKRVELYLDPVSGDLVKKKD
ncbi:MAG: PepSY domain-containing protein [Geminicoccaceae bacterium]|nr:PepSY domain-containing protein [Geminicoccaceae bacterium]